MESSGGVASSSVFASVSEAPVLKSGVIVKAEVERVVGLASGFMEAAAIETADSWDVDSTEGIPEATRDVGAIVVKAAPMAELGIDVTWTVVAAIGDGVSGVLVAASDP